MAMGLPMMEKSLAVGRWSFGMLVLSSRSSVTIDVAVAKQQVLRFNQDGNP